MVEAVKTPTQRTRKLDPEQITQWFNPESSYGRYVRDGNGIHFQDITSLERMQEVFVGKGIDFIFDELKFQKSYALEGEEGDEGEAVWMDKNSPREDGLKRTDMVRAYLELCKVLGREFY